MLFVHLVQATDWINSIPEIGLDARICTLGIFTDVSVLNPERLSQKRNNT